MDVERVYMTRSWTDLSWPERQAGEAIAALVGKTRLSSTRANIENPPSRCGKFDRAAWTRWIASSVSGMDIEAEEVDSSYAELDTFLRQAGPALLKVSCDGTPAFLALVKSSRNKAALLTPSLRLRWVPASKLRNLLSDHL